MGTAESSCTRCCSGGGSAPKVDIVQPSWSNNDDDGYVCTEWSHVESLLAHLPPDVHAALENKDFQKRCHQSFRDIVSRRAQSDGRRLDSLEGDELIEAVHLSVPESFLRDRLHAKNLTKLVLAFDTDSDGRIKQSEFDLFCMWAVAMDVMGLFAGTTPFAKIANEFAAERLLIVSEFLDPEHVLERCALPTTTCAYYHPDGITLDEFSAQITSAAHVRTKQGMFFQSVALANHGPDEQGLWNVCSDHPLSLQSLDTAWPRIMPMFQALADMVSDPAHLGHVDLLACNFAANQTGVKCLDMIESQVNARFSASTDATGNVAQKGNWELERGGRNVAPIYFHEEMLGEFTKVMAPSASRLPNLDNGMAHFQESASMIGKTRMPVDADPYSVANSKDISRKKREEKECEVSASVMAAVAGGDCPERRHAGPKAKAKAKRKPPMRHNDAKGGSAFAKG